MLSYVIAIPEFNKLTNFSFDSRIKKKTLKNLARKNETKDALNLGDKIQKTLKIISLIKVTLKMMQHKIIEYFS